MVLFRASELFEVEQAEPEIGMPAWANLNIRKTKQSDRDAMEPASLTGPGIYGVFFDGYLIYIGLYSGTETDPFAGSVLERWPKHVGGMTLRSRVVFFKSQPLQNIIRHIPGKPADDLARTLPRGRDTIFTEVDPAECPPLRTRQILSGFNKAFFATKNWTALAPGSEAGLLGRFTFMYQQVPLPNGERPDKRHVKYTWLKPREAALIRHFRPICNDETDPATARFDAAPEEVSTEITRLLLGPLEPFTPTTKSAVPAPEDASPLTARAEEDDGPDDDGANDNEASVGETLFRQRISPDGGVFLAEFLRDCPDGLVPFFNKKVGQMRVRLKVGQQRRLLVVAPGRGGVWRCTTLAGVEVCRAIGLDAAPCRPGEAVMRASFPIDPAVDRPAILYAVLGAAAEGASPRF